MEEQRDDYVWTSEDGKVTITVPKLDGLVEVETKLNLTTDEMSQYEIDGFEGLGNPLINFYVETVQEPYTPVIRFNPKMKLDAEEDGDFLVYLDLCKEKWIKFEDQEKENGIATVRIKEWAADPQVAWGF